MAAVEQQRGVFGGRPPETLIQLNEAVVACRACPRLTAWREEVASVKRAAYMDEEYWGRPVPGFGDPNASICIVGLAPGAHGSNRTGRMFTGDRSGDWLFAALHRAGLASQPESIGLDDGLTLDGVWITAPVKCVPPDNKPTPGERDTCAEWFDVELDLLGASVFVTLGAFGFHSLWRSLGRSLDLPRPRPQFAHGEVIALPDGRSIVTSYHVSQQNTFTGRLTEAMLDSVFEAAKDLAGLT